MRIYGRIYKKDGSYTWTEIQTDANGNNDGVYITALCQELQLQIGESPFYANRGIDVRGSLITQVFPTYWVNQIQQNYATYFLSLTIIPVNQLNQYGALTPVYNINIITHQGAVINLVVPQ